MAKKPITPSGVKNAASTLSKKTASQKEKTLAGTALAERKAAKTCKGKK